MAKTKKVGNYELRETLGRGTFSKVKRAVNLTNGAVVAIKIIDVHNFEQDGLQKQVKREILVLKNLKHANIVELHEVLKSQNRIYIVMELVSGGELFDRIVAAKRFDEKTARFYFQQLIYGIRYCHACDVAHRDLKPENLLLSGTTLKISDFGLSGICNKNKDFFSTVCGTPHYVAPEVLSGKYDGKIADIWSCGIILFVMVSGCHPFDGDNVNDLFRRIENLEFKYPPYFSQKLRALLDKIIVLDPQKRAIIPDILNDAWFQESQESANGSLAVVAPSATASDDEDALVEVEYEEKVSDSHPVDFSQMNAFELISYVTEVNLVGKQRTMLMVAGVVASVRTQFVNFLKSNKFEVKGAKKSFELKVAKKGGFSDLQFSVTFTQVAQQSLALVEVTKTKGNSLKFHEIFRILFDQFATKKPSSPASVAATQQQGSPIEDHQESDTVALRVDSVNH